VAFIGYRQPRDPNKEKSCDPSRHAFEHRTMVSSQGYVVSDVLRWIYAAGWAKIRNGTPQRVPGRRHRRVCRPRTSRQDLLHFDDAQTPVQSLTEKADKNCKSHVHGACGGIAPRRA
jgi:hypothetical protein